MICNISYFLSSSAQTQFLPLKILETVPTFQNLTRTNKRTEWVYEKWFWILVIWSYINRKWWPVKQRTYYILTISIYFYNDNHFIELFQTFKKHKCSGKFFRFEVNFDTREFSWNLSSRVKLLRFMTKFSKNWIMKMASD